MRLYRKLRHAVDNHGLWGMVQRAARKVLRRSEDAGEPGPHRPEPAGQHPFDREHGVETSGWIPGEELEAGTASDLYITAYYGIAPSTLRQALRHFPERTAEYTFVDLGCGKGRALLVASKFGFGRLLGVELAPELCRVAWKNLAGRPGAGVVEADAATVVYPEGPLLVYFFHPFLAPVLKRVLRNLQAQAGTRPVYVLYANPTYPKVMRRFPRLREVWDFSFRLSEEDLAADRFGSPQDRFTLYRLEPAAR